eukprot:g9620.t1
MFGNGFSLGRGKPKKDPKQERALRKELVTSLLIFGGVVICLRLAPLAIRHDRRSVAVWTAFKRRPRMPAAVLSPCLRQLHPRLVTELGNVST